MNHSKVDQKERDSRKHYRVVADRLENNPEFWIGGDEDARLRPDIQDAVEVLRRDELLLPTREQIAETIYTVRAGSNQNWHKAAFRDDYLKEADAVLALVQEGADRG